MYKVLGGLCPRAARVDTYPSRVGRGSGLTGPHRRTFALAIQASALSMLTALRHPACDDQSTYGGSVPEQRRLLGPGQPLTDSAFETVNSNLLGVDKEPVGPHDAVPGAQQAQKPEVFKWKRAS